MSSESSTPQQWPGQRLGLPESGPRSIARLGRRLGALAIDWGLAVLLAVAFFDYNPVALQLIFLVLQVVPLILVNATAGHLITGMRVQRLVGGRLGVWPPLVRSALLTLVVPAMFWDSDQRGLHDRAVGTILLRR